MFFTGFADEAAAGIKGQIQATKELGWSCIESRNIDGINIHDLPEDQFNFVAEQLEHAGVRINCFGSGIANWGQKIDEPFDLSLEQTRRAVPRMKRLGVDMIRIMSFAVLPGRGPEDQMKQERFRRLRELVAIFTDAGVVPVHENCMNYGGMGWPFTLELLEHVPGLKLVFDTGNPVFTDDYTKPEPRPKQSSWEFYSHVKEHIAYIHIKDGVWNPVEKKTTFTWPGEGDGDVDRILADLIRCGYDGGISIEPHLGAVYHEDSPETEEDRKYSMYIEYGKRVERTIARLLTNQSE
jgi:sugar phosphate isomerase/epimerase